MRTFQQFLESVPAGVNPHRYHIGEIQGIIDNQERRINELVEKNAMLLKTLAKIKIDLERALKDKTKLNDAVYNSINLARGLTPYTNDYGKTHIVDPALNDIEKTL